MKQRDIDDIAKFLASVGKSSLFEYFDVATDASDEAVGQAIQKRRAWAQGQQANPKYRQEAIWVIKNVRRCRTAMTDERAAYLAILEGESRDQSVEVLRVFIMGALASGVLSPRGEATIEAKGRELGLDQATIRSTVDRMLTEHNAQRGDSTASSEGHFADHYAVLEVHPNSDLATLERAYRDRYRWARQLDDSRRAAVIYERLDEAWRVLKDPPSRARYDEERAEVLGPDAVRTGPNLGTHGGEPERELESTGSQRRISFAEGDEPEEEREVTNPNIPAPPEAIGSTLGMGANQRSALPSRPATLVVDGPETLPVRLRGKPTSVALMVRREGAGPMPGRVFVDRDWVEVSPARLDRDADAQAVTITVYPGRMPRKKAVALVTVLTDDGQRQAVTVQAAQQQRLGVLVGAAALGVAVVGGGAGWLLQPPPPPPPDPPSAELAVQVDPPAGKVFVANELVNSTGTAEVTEGLTPGSTVLVRVELDGFEPWSQEVAMPGDGERVALTPTLELVDRMEYEPKAEDLEAPLDKQVAQRAVGSRRAQIAQCMHAYGGVAAGEEVILGVEAYVSNRGRVVGARFAPQGFEAKSDLLTCIRRQLRSIELPLIQGDYAVFSHNVRYREPAGDASP